MELPTILLLTDGFPHANGAGISQTLYNLFNGYNGKLILLIGESEVLPDPSLRLPAQTLSYDDRRYRTFGRKILIWFNGIRERQRLHWIATKPLSGICLPELSQTLVLVSTTVPEKLLLAWRLQQKYGYAIVPYFMDDWLADNEMRWKGGNIKQVAKDLLANAPAWLMISENLKQVLMERYDLEEKPTLVVHNPAPEIIDDGLRMTDDRGGFVAQNSNLISPLLSPDSHRDVTYHLLTIIYAGSIWPMHADALIAVAKAVHLLQRSGHATYTLNIYAPQAQWQRYESELAGPGVYYKGWLPANDVQKKLPEAWLLLCTASFVPAHAAFSHSSTQTKLTTYMAAGCPVLYVGPTDGASGHFVQQWQCGYTINSRQPEEIALQLQAIEKDQTGWRQKSGNALLAAATTFSKNQVQQKLYNFLSRYAG
jgi:glycosyltransferase involved in cell wall biosynthesis